ncbi:MAG: hypothetical protein AAF607_12200 [Pseudomonadota bacterium]
MTTHDNAPESPLGPLRAVTFAVADTQAWAEHYREHLGYQTRAERSVTEEEAIGWGTPGVAGRKMVILQAQSGQGPVLRSVEQADYEPPAPFRTLGWNAAELIVEDIYALADTLAGSPFKIIGPPQVLDFDFTDKISAMQVVGPDQEVLYLTSVAGDVPGFDLPQAQSFVGHAFITILGGESLDSLGAFFLQRFGRSAGPAITTKIGVLANAYGHDPAQTYDISTVALPGSCVVEIDAFPPEATLRSPPPGLLPGPMALVSYLVDDLSPYETEAIGPVYPNDHGKALTLSGPAGALFELVQGHID